MKDHPIASIFPLLPEPELADLASDIKANGLKQRIVIYQDMILDGRNRYRACLRAGVEPLFQDFQNGQSAVSYVISLNLRRRHLTPTQSACCAVEALPWLEKEAKERQRMGREKIPHPEDCGKARDKAADLFKTNAHYVSDAKAIKESSPVAFEAMLAGEKTLTEVKRTINREAAVKGIKKFPSGKFRVLYADPPWKYGDGRETLPGTTGASAHYPSMTIAELCALPILDIVDPDAVLFLWVTSPLLFECAPIIPAWGFKYKASFVWDKVKHNIGHYNSVRHEFLLLCTRGSCLPDIPELIDSVQSIERSAKHSEKPKEFREIIDKLYPHGKRIELFARQSIEGWSAYGNDAAIK